MPKVHCPSCNKDVEPAKSNWPTWKILLYNPIAYLLWKKADKCPICGNKIIDNK